MIYNNYRIKMINDINYEDIRKDWTKYKNIISKKEYDSLWNDLQNKFFLDEADNFLILFKRFISNQDLVISKYEVNIVLQDKNTLILKGLNGNDRKDLHKLCDKIGLHHQSILKKNHKKHLYIYKPEIWLWEYTIRNPYSENDEVYNQREIEGNLKKEKMLEKLRKSNCDMCGNNGIDTELYHSVYIRGIYCDDCLEIESDGEGGVLSDHKFEPISF